MNLLNVLTKKTFIGAVSALSIALFAPSMISDALANPNHGHGGFSGPSHQGGYKGPSNASNITTLKQAQKLSDDSYATLRGKIVSHVGGDVYLFEDASGQGKIEIDDDIWRGLHVNQGDLVEIVVEIDKDWNHVKLEAEQIRKAH